MISLLNKTIFFLSLFSAAQSFAQESAAAPEQTQPAAPVAAKPATATPHDTLSIPVAPGPMSSAAVPPASIESSPVGAPSLDGFGIPDAKGESLPATLWNGSKRDDAVALLALLRGGVHQPMLRDLTLQLLMSQANPPEGAPARQDDWFTGRIEALLAMGADDKAEQLIASVPASFSSDTLKQTRATLLLLRGETEEACKLVDGAGISEVPYWRRASILCKALQGKRDEALLALDVMQEASDKEEPFLRDIVQKLTAKLPVRAMPPRWTLFDTAAMRLAGETMKLKDKLDFLPPLALKYIAADSAADPKLREKAYAKASQLALLPPKDNTKLPPTPFATPLASDITTLVTAFESGGPVTEADNAVIARLAVDDSAAIQDCRRVQRMLTLMEPFGYRVPADIWNKLFLRNNRYDGDMPPAILLDRLSQAAAAGRKGETVLLSALILGSNDVEKTNEIVLLPIVKALNAAGFTKEARGIAYDAIQSYRAR